MPCYEVLNPAHIPRAVFIRQRTLATLQHPSAPLSTLEHPSAPLSTAPSSSAALNEDGATRAVMMPSRRWTIDAQQAVLAKIFRVFEDVDVQDCKFKITHVAKNLLALEGNVTSRLTSHFAETLRYRLPSGASVIKQNKVVKFATFNDIVTAAVGCASIPTFNNFLAHLRQMGVATDLLASAAFGQHARSIYEASSVTFCAIRGIPHEPHRRLPRTCNFIIRGGMKQCPRNSIKGSNTCARHTTTKRRRVA